MKEKNEMFLKYQLFIIVLFFLAFVLSCKNINYEKSYNLGLIESDSLLVIPIPSDVITNSRHVQFLYGKEQIKLLAYATSNSLLFFNIDSQNLYKHVRFERYGPNGIGTIRGFHVISPDSILIISQFSIMLFDSEPNLLKKNDLHSIKHNLHNFLSPSNRNYNPVVRLEDRFYFSTFMFDLDRDDLLSSSVGVCYDINEDSIFPMSVNYPMFPYGYDSKGLYYSRLFYNNKWLYSFVFFDEIYVLEESGHYTLISAPSSMRSNDKLHKISARINSSPHQQVRNPKYMALTFDPWQDVFYRFFYPGFDSPEGEKEDFYDSLLDTPVCFSIIILNAKLEIVGETRMPFQMYDPGSFFVSENGLFIALHANHPEYNPDSLKYARFSVENNRKIK
jgi:hypothetical protein